MSNIKIKGSASAKLKWNIDPQKKCDSAVKRAQMYVDSEVLRYCAAMVPLQTGNLKQSGTTGTTVGSGEVRYIAPYAAYQYYNTHLDHSSNKNAQGGPKWFERMKAAYKDDILRGAQRMINGD